MQKNNYIKQVDDNWVIFVDGKPAMRSKSCERAKEAFMRFMKPVQIVKKVTVKSVEEQILELINEKDLNKFTKKSIATTLNMLNSVSFGSAWSSLSKKEILIFNFEIKKWEYNKKENR